MPAASGTVTANTAATAAQYNNLRKDLVTSQLSYLTSVSGTNTIVGTADAQYVAYAEGDSFWLKVAVTNTGAVTLNVNTLGAKDVQKLERGGLVALVPRDLIAGMMLLVAYDGARFIVQKSLPLLKTFTANTKSLNIAGSDSIVWAHGLGFTPTKVVFSGNMINSSTMGSFYGVFDGTNAAAHHGVSVNDGTLNSFSTDPSNFMRLGFSSGNYVTFNISIDATNVTLSMSETGSAGGTINYTLEAYLETP